jgi:hypothetical protein
MKKKLYEVKVVLYVMAEDKSDACYAATQAKFDVFECEAQRARIVDPAWLDAVPYNADDARTCSEIVAANRTDTYPTAGAMPVASTQAWKMESASMVM